MIEKQRNKTGEKEFWKKKKEHTCRAARLTRAGLLLGVEVHQTYALSK